MEADNALRVARAILACADEAPLQVLSLAPGLSPVVADTPVAEARRNYMRLASLVHPDKIKSKFDKSTEVFQKLVKAFELVADPKYRKRLLSQQIKGVVVKAKRERKQQQGSKKKNKNKKVASAATSRKLLKKSPVKKRRIGNSAVDFVENDSDEDTEGSESDDTGSDIKSDDEGSSSDFAPDDAEPTVSTSRALLGTRRTGGIYCDTIIRCPQCRATWEPDTKQHYTLFMGPAGKRVHCEMCLCHFGCATALHACPHCQRSFEYDSSMYDTEVRCVGCSKNFGFPYYPVNQHLIDLVRLEQWREQAGCEKMRERDERAARRQKDNANTADTFHSLLGVCIVDEKCPLCKRTVISKHRQHLEACLKVAPEMKIEKPVPKQRGAKVRVAPAAPKNASRKSAPKPAARRSRKCSTDSDSDEHESDDDSDDNDVDEEEEELGSSLPSSSGSD